MTHSSCDRRLRLLWLLALVAWSCAQPSGRNSSDLPPPAARRVFEPRLPGHPYAECPLLDQGVGLRATCPPPSGEEQTEIARAGRAARGAADGSETESRAQTIARLIAAQKAEDFAGTLERLERRAAAATPAGAEALTDLAAAYLLRAEVLGDANDLLGAARAARAALEREADFPPALFNLALSYEMLLLRRAAIGTWIRLLAAESDQGWAAEAEAHLEDLEAELAAAENSSRGGQERLFNDIQEEREHAAAVLFPRWAELVLGSADRAAIAKIEAELEDLAGRSRAAGDPFLAEASRALRLGDRRALAKAHRQLASRRQAFEGQLPEACLPGLDELAAAFREQKSPFALEVLRLEATCAYFGLDLEGAAAFSLAWQTEARRSGFPVSTGLASWFRGTVASERGEYANAKNLYQEAIGLIEPAGEPRRLGGLHALLAYIKARSGDPSGAWRLLHASLKELVESGDNRLSPTFHEAAFELTGAGMPELALLYSEENLFADLAGADLRGRFDARWLRCSLLQKSGRQAEAVREFERLRAELSRVPDPKERRRLEVLAHSAECEIFLGENPARSAAAASAALAAYQAVSFDTTPLDLHLVLARAQARLGEESRALETLEQGLAYFSSQTIKDPEISAKVRLFERAGKMLEEKMQLELGQGRQLHRGHFPRRRGLAQEL